jgi:hypothetical protein
MREPMSNAHEADEIPSCRSWQQVLKLAFHALLSQHAPIAIHENKSINSALSRVSQQDSR